MSFVDVQDVVPWVGVAEAANKTNLDTFPAPSYRIPVRTRCSTTSMQNQYGDPNELIIRRRQCKISMETQGLE